MPSPNLEASPAAQAVDEAQGVILAVSVVDGGVGLRFDMRMGEVRYEDGRGAMVELACGAI
eukprot:4552141-Prymnesium_polylepis.1